MATREWFLTKIIVTALGLVTLISTCIGGANVLFEVKRSVMRVEEHQNTHESLDEKKWDKVTADIEESDDRIRAIELQNSRTETNQKEIIRRLDELQRVMSNLDVVR